MTGIAVRLLGPMFVGLGLIVPPLASATAAGRTAGAFAVSDTGSASYTIPVQVPQGVAGLQPNLALRYDSARGNGLLGVGWVLDGFSAITRCDRTQAQDGVTGSPQLDANDRFCLDGSRLRSTNSTTYGADGSTYATELATFSSVISHGTAGSGPNWFEVRDGDGKTYEYGRTQDSAILAFGSTSVRVWALNKISDPNGNSMTFTYANDTANGSYRPQSIQYTYTSLNPSNASYQITFTYQSRATADGLWTYTIGGKNDELNYLSQIAARYWNGTTWTTVRSYTLSYGNSPVTSRTRLNSVQECSATDCFGATTISYQNGQTGWGNEISNAGNMSLGFILPIDLNGDGIEDLAYPDPVSNRWYYLIGTTSGVLQGPYDTGIASTSYASAVPIDYNSDGKTDILVPNGSGFWRVMFFQSVGGTFTSTNTSTPSVTSGDGSVMTGDIDGDGRQDLIYAVSNGTTNWETPDYIYYRLNTGSGFSSTVGTLLQTQSSIPTGLGTKLASATPLTKNATRSRSRVRAPDFNGDARIDFFVSMKRCIVNDDGSCNTLTYTTALWSKSDGTYGNASVSGSAAALNGDANGDGCSDYFSSPGVVFGGCYRAGGSITGGSATIGTVNGISMVADWDADGRDDLLQFSLTTGTWGYQRSNGSTFNAWVNLGIPFSGQPTVYLIADINGDGLDDLLYVVAGSLRTRLHNGVKPDLATSFVDAYGNSVSPSYTSLTQNNYTKYADAAFPEQDYQGPLHVVSSFSASNGIGGSFTKSFWYYGARVNLQGRGFEGFYSKRTIDSRNGLYNYRYYRRDFPYIGAVYQDDLYQSNGSTLIRRLQNNFTSTTLDSTANNQRYFPRISSSTALSYEVGGIKNSQLISTAVTNYTFDTSGNATNVATTVTDNDGESPYYGLQWSSTTAKTISPQAGCLGLPTRITITNTAPGVPTLTRTTDFVPNYTRCRIDQVVTEPASPTYKVTRVLGYDAFGNLSTETVTGIGMAARSTTINWGSTGQFPVSITNPLNQTTGMGYDYGLGVQTSQTDPNNLTVNWGYDGFGRRISELRPDGTATSIAYTSCTPSCFNANHRITVTQTSINVGGSVLTDQLTYLDQLGRPLATSQRLMGGTYNRVETRYDALGRVSQQSFPCVASSCTSYWSTFGYDALDRVTLQQRPISATNAVLQSTSIAYLGRTATVTDALGRNTIRITTPVGILGRSQDHDGYYQNFNYDSFGNLLAVSDSLSNTLFTATYDYGADAFKRTVSDMDLGSRSFTYNALGELTNGSDGKGQSFSATYDTLSRMLTRAEAEGTTTFTYGNSAAARNIGQLQAMSSPGYSEQYTYDQFGRLSNRQIVSDTTYAYDYTYNATTGLPDTLTYPSSILGYRLRLQYLYQNGVLQQVKDFNSSTVFWRANDTNPRGQVTQETFGNGVTTNRSLDAVTGWMSTLQSGVGGGAALQNESYLFDLMGNTTQRQNNNLGLTENFYYDNLYRLDYSRLNNVINLDLSYDAMGNITGRSDVAGGATWTYHATRKHAVVQAGSANYTYAYDANGNAQTRNGYGITWTSYNYPAVINGPNKTLAFSYGPTRQRFKQIYTNGSAIETTMYVGGLMEKVTAAGVTDWRHYVSAGGATVAIVSRQSNGNNATRYILQDHQGSIAQITDSAGASYVAESFTAFGGRRDANTWSGACQCADLAKMKDVTRHGYTGHEAIGGVSMGLNHMNGRVQDAITGRFLSPDPYITEPSNTQNYNRYSYVGNNPLSHTDPSGFASAAWLARLHRNRDGGSEISTAQEFAMTAGNRTFNLRYGNGSVNGIPAMQSTTGAQWAQQTLLNGHRGVRGAAGVDGVVGQLQWVSGGASNITEADGSQASQVRTTTAGHWETSSSVGGTGLWDAWSRSSRAFGNAIADLSMAMAQPSIDMAYSLANVSRGQGTKRDALNIGVGYAIMGLSAIPGGGFADDAARGTTTLYRAVSPAELADIAAMKGVLRNPLGIESKYFSLTAEGATSYARQTFGTGLYQGPYTIIETAIPTSRVPEFLAPYLDRGIPTLVVPTESLWLLSPATPLRLVP